jgi:hypothetical protein
MMAGGTNEAGGSLEDILDVKAGQSIAFTRSFNPASGKNV